MPSCHACRQDGMMAFVGSAHPALQAHAVLATGQRRIAAVCLGLTATGRIARRMQSPRARPSRTEPSDACSPFFIVGEPAEVEGHRDLQSSEGFWVRADQGPRRDAPAHPRQRHERRAPEPRRPAFAVADRSTTQTPSYRCKCPSGELGASGTAPLPDAATGLAGWSLESETRSLAISRRSIESSN